MFRVFFGVLALVAAACNPTTSHAEERAGQSKHPSVTEVGAHLGKVVKGLTEGKTGNAKSVGYKPRKSS